jgi:hypothetical protein
MPKPRKPVAAGVLRLCVGERFLRSARTRRDDLGQASLSVVQRREEEEEEVAMRGYRVIPSLSPVQKGLSCQKKKKKKTMQNPNRRVSPLPAPKPADLAARLCPEPFPFPMPSAKERRREKTQD